MRADPLGLQRPAETPGAWLSKPSLFIVLTLLAALPACVVGRTRTVDGPERLFQGALQGLIPHAPGDRFVYKVTGGATGDRTLTGVISSSDRPDEVFFTILRGDLVVSRSRFRDDGTTLSLLSELGPQQNMAVSYQDPLPMARTPLDAGEHTFSTGVKLLRLPRVEVMAEGQIEQTTLVERGERFEETGEVVVRMKRRMTLPGRVVESRTVTWIVPGQGWVKSKLKIGDGPEELRELVCVMVDGTRIGDCETPLLAEN